MLQKTKKKLPKGYSLELFFDRNGIEYRKDIKQYKGKQCEYYNISECLYDSAHKDPDALFIRYTDGTIIYKCSHNSCKDHTDGIEALRIINSDEIDRNLVEVSPKDKALKPVRNTEPIVLQSVEEIAEKIPEWLISARIPGKAITLLAGDGGAGKTSIWCNLAAAVSSGSRSILDDDNDNPWRTDPAPQKVIFFSSEDSTSYVLKEKLRKNGANMSNIFTLSLENERFRDIKFNSPELRDIVAGSRPALMIFDPLQSFLPPGTKMSARNEMREALNDLIGLGEEYGTTFLIIMHTNKQVGVWGRKRIADSADIWDIARSVLIVGSSADGKLHYISHEKCNYGKLASTILFEISEDGIPIPAGSSDKRDRDYVCEVDYSSRQRPERENAISLIRDYLEESSIEDPIPVSEFDEYAKSIGITTATLRRAKGEMKAAGQIKYLQKGFGKDVKYYIYLVHKSQ